jgi:hypothetical protein
MPGGDLTVLEDEEGWYALNPKFACDLGFGIDVDLDEPRLGFELLRGSHATITSARVVEGCPIWKRMTKWSSCRVWVT